MYAMTRNWESEIKERLQRAALFIEYFLPASLPKVNWPIDFGNTMFRNRNFSQCLLNKPDESQRGNEPLARWPSIWKLLIASIAEALRKSTRSNEERDCSGSLAPGIFSHEKS